MHSFSLLLYCSCLCCHSFLRWYVTFYHLFTLYICIAIGGPFIEKGGGGGGGGMLLANLTTLYMYIYVLLLEVHLLRRGGGGGGPISQFNPATFFVPIPGRDLTFQCHMTWSPFLCSLN